MKTSLKYSVIKKETWNALKDKMVLKVVSRGYDFCVSGVLTEEEHKKVINSFAKYLEENGYTCDGFGEGSWDDAINQNNFKEFLYLSIPVESTEDKEAIKTLYNEWKTYYKRLSNV